MDCKLYALRDKTRGWYNGVGSTALFDGNFAEVIIFRNAKKAAKTAKDEAAQMRKYHGWDLEKLHDYKSPDFVRPHWLATDAEFYAEIDRLEASVRSYVDPDIKVVTLTITEPTD
jgi:hypothetical protein